LWSDDGKSGAYSSSVGLIPANALAVIVVLLARSRRIIKGRPLRVGLIVGINAYREEHPYE
jgi:hypothetical protein